MLERVDPVTVVAIPVHNEGELIGPCLAALDAQVGAQLTHIVLLANNCTDDSVEIARSVPIRPGTALQIVEMHLPPSQSSAGHARRLAMQCAAALAGPTGILLTTDGDSRVDPAWLAANLRALAHGVDVVCGWVDLDPEDWHRIPLKLHQDDARECAYDRLCDEIHARLDPDPDDPLPRHTQHSGASIALTAPIFARCGGVPDLPSGEDRALLAALRRVDARIRHAPEVHVTVSGRIMGRSKGGMADTIRRRLGAPDRYLDDRLEPARDCARRATARQRLRRVLETGYGGAELATELAFDPARLQTLLNTGLGAAWQVLETKSPVLRRRRVRVTDLPAQMAAAEAILAGLDPGDRCDIPLSALRGPGAAPEHSPLA